MRTLGTLLLTSMLLTLLALGCGSSTDNGGDCTCTGDSCCCGGSDAECKQGYLCGGGGQCKTITQFAFTITVTGKVNSKPPKSSSWDADGLPDPYVKVLRYGSQQCKSSTANNTLDINASCKLSTLSEGTKLTVEVHDEDTSGDALIFKGGWPSGIPYSAFVDGASTKLSGTVDHTGGLSVTLKKN